MTNAERPLPFAPMSPPLSGGSPRALVAEGPGERSPLDLGPLTRQLIQLEDNHRAGMTMVTSDVRAMIDEISRLVTALFQARDHARFASLALLDHDLEKVRQHLDLILHPETPGPEPEGGFNDPNL